MSKFLGIFKRQPDDSLVRLTPDDMAEMEYQSWVERFHSLALKVSSKGFNMKSPASFEKWASNTIDFMDAIIALEDAGTQLAKLLKQARTRP